jgi:uncharacterized membrane-anchored protein YjiN (DUF445 family)
MGQEGEIDVSIRRPRRQRRLALVVLLTAAGLAVAAFPFRGTWWGGWILAVAEAGVVGGLADWFAVTALFRHPLGIPIPHTALIPANWQLMAARVGTMVGNRVLTAEYVIREIERVDVADLLARGALHLNRMEIESVAGAVLRWGSGQLTSESAAELAAWLRRMLIGQPVAPILAEALEVVQRHGWDQRAIETVAGALVVALDRPRFREAVIDLVDGVVGRYRERMGTYPSFLIGLANLLGLIDRERLVAALAAALRKVAEDPDDPLRRQLSAALGDLPGRLRAEPDLAARVETAKAELLNSAAVTKLFADAAGALQAALSADVSRQRSELVAWVTAQLERARRAVASDAALRGDLDRWLKKQAAALVERYQERVAAFIERGVHALGAEGAVRLIEEHAGDDLQYIRVNGTVVGGLAGGAIYAVHLLLRLA